MKGNFLCIILLGLLLGTNSLCSANITYESDLISVVSPDSIQSLSKEEKKVLIDSLYDEIKTKLYKNYYPLYEYNFPVLEKKYLFYSIASSDNLIERETQLIESLYDFKENYNLLTQKDDSISFLRPQLESYLVDKFESYYKSYFLSKMKELDYFVRFHSFNEELEMRDSTLSFFNRINHDIRLREYLVNQIDSLDNIITSSTGSHKVIVSNEFPKVVSIKNKFLSTKNLATSIKVGNQVVQRLNYFLLKLKEYEDFEKYIRINEDEIFTRLRINFKNIYKYEKDSYGEIFTNYLQSKSFSYKDSLMNLAKVHLEFIDKQFYVLKSLNNNLDSLKQLISGLYRKEYKKIYVNEISKLRGECDALKNIIKIEDRIKSSLQLINNCHYALQAYSQFVQNDSIIAARFGLLGFRYQRFKSIKRNKLQQLKDDIYQYVESNEIWQKLKYSIYILDQLDQLTLEYPIIKYQDTRINLLFKEYKLDYSTNYSKIYKTKKKLFKGLLNTYHNSVNTEISIDNQKKLIDTLVYFHQYFHEFQKIDSSVVANIMAVVEKDYPRKIARVVIAIQNVKEKDYKYETRLSEKLILGYSLIDYLKLVSKIQDDYFDELLEKIKWTNDLKEKEKLLIYYSNQ